MTQAFGPVSLENREDIAVITLDEPERLNPLSDDMRQGLGDAIEHAMNDGEVRTLIITGAGGNFTAGADIKQLNPTGSADPVRARRRLAVLQRVIRLIVNGPKPVVCAVEGATFGAGLSIAAACDYVIVGETVRFGAAFAKIGLAADCGIVWTLPRRIGGSLARDLMFTGRPVKADEALRIGLADAMVGEGQALDAAIAKAAEYRASAPLSIAAIKSAFAAGASSINDVLDFELQQQPMLSMTLDHAEGIAAFKEKRASRFEGR